MSMQADYLVFDTFTLRMMLHDKLESMELCPASCHYVRRLLALQIGAIESALRSRSVAVVPTVFTMSTIQATD